MINFTWHIEYFNPRAIRKGFDFLDEFKPLSNDDLLDYAEIQRRLERIQQRNVTRRTSVL